MNYKKVAIENHLYQHLRMLAKIESLTTGHRCTISQLVRRAISEKYDYPKTQIEISQNSVLEESKKWYALKLPS